MWAAMSIASNTIKTGLFTLFVPLVVAVWVPRRVIANGDAVIDIPLLWRVPGGLLCALGATGYFWCAGLFVRAPVFPTKRAVVGGLYRINRNPMYTSVLAVVFGQALFYGSQRVALYGVFLFVCFHLFVLFYEEHTLRSQFNGEYEEFCRKVPRWIPRLRGRVRR